MCKCTPESRTPFCGKGDCVWPHTVDPDARPEPPEPRVMIPVSEYEALKRVADLTERYFRGEGTFISLHGALAQLKRAREGT